MLFLDGGMVYRHDGQQQRQVRTQHGAEGAAGRVEVRSSERIGGGGQDGTHGKEIVSETLFTRLALAIGLSRCCL